MSKKKLGLINKQSVLKRVYITEQLDWQPLFKFMLHMEDLVTLKVSKS
jgi:hypothetical protein